MTFKNKKLFFIFFIFIFFYSCNYNNQNNKRLKFYFEGINFIKNKNLYNHFPEKAKIEKYNISVPCVGGRGLEIDIFNKENDSFISDLKNKIENNVKFKYSINNPCTNFFLNKIDTIPFQYRNCINNNVPVPNYVFWLDPDRTIFDYKDIKNDLVYYVLDYGEGHYLADSLLTDNISNSIIKNGFSKGYAISKKAKLVVYWLLIW